MNLNVKFCIKTTEQWHFKGQAFSYNEINPQLKYLKCNKINTDSPFYKIKIFVSMTSIISLN